MKMKCGVCGSEVPADRMMTKKVCVKCFLKDPLRFIRSGDEENEAKGLNGKTPFFFKSGSVEMFVFANDLREAEKKFFEHASKHLNEIGLLVLVLSNREYLVSILPLNLYQHGYISEKLVYDALKPYGFSDAEISKMLSRRIGGGGRLVK